MNLGFYARNYLRCKEKKNLRGTIFTSFFMLDGGIVLVIYAIVRVLGMCLIMHSSSFLF